MDPYCTTCEAVLESRLERPNLPRILELQSELATCSRSIADAGDAERKSKFAKSAVYFLHSHIDYWPMTQL